MEEKKDAPLEQTNSDEQPAADKTTDELLSDEQLDNAVGGTTEPTRRLEDIDNRTITQPIDVENI